jgi:hypothetical protein
MQPARSHFTSRQTEPSWRTFEVTTRVEVRQAAGVTRVWLPTALRIDTPYHRTLSNEPHAPGGRVSVTGQEPDALGVVMAEFPESVPAVVTLVSRVATCANFVDLSRPTRRASLEAPWEFRPHGRLSHVTEEHR